jgi:hypothetical protein
LASKIDTHEVLCYIVRDDQLLVFRHTDFDLEQVASKFRPGRSVLLKHQTQCASCLI